MKTTSKYNKSEIMKEAHNLYKSNNRFGWSFGKSLSVAWDNAKMRIKNAEVESKNEAFRAIWKAQHEAKVAKENELYAATYTGTPADYYRGNRFNGD